MVHINFWWKCMGKVGAPIFVATLVGCLLSGKYDLLHSILMLTGLVMMGLSHRWEYHQRKTCTSLTQTIPYHLQMFPEGKQKLDDLARSEYKISDKIHFFLP